MIEFLILQLYYEYSGCQQYSYSYCIEHSSSILSVADSSPWHGRHSGIGIPESRCAQLIKFNLKPKYRDLLCFLLLNQYKIFTEFHIYCRFQPQWSMGEGPLAAATTTRPYLTLLQPSSRAWINWKSASPPSIRCQSLMKLSDTGIISSHLNSGFLFPNLLEVSEISSVIGFWFIPALPSTLQGTNSLSSLILKWHLR